MHRYWVYIMANRWNTTIYIGVTNDIRRRAMEHKLHLNKGSFTDQYNVEKLVWFEEFNYINEAIAREKQLKNWKREWKNTLVNKTNPAWADLSVEWEDARTGDGGSSPP